MFSTTALSPIHDFRHRNTSDQRWAKQQKRQKATNFCWNDWLKNGLAQITRVDWSISVAFCCFLAPRPPLLQTCVVSSVSNSSYFVTVWDSQFNCRLSLSRISSFRLFEVHQSLFPIVSSTAHSYLIHAVLGMVILVTDSRKLRESSVKTDWNGKLKLISSN